jgi:hypothetical protein
LIFAGIFHGLLYLFLAICDGCADFKNGIFFRFFTVFSGSWEWRILIFGFSVGGRSRAGVAFAKFPWRIVNGAPAEFRE